MVVSELFSSDLQRAQKTAEAIQDAQRKLQRNERHSLHVEKLSVLREQDFGFYEGKPFYAKPRDSSKSGKESHRSQHINDPSFKDVESKEAMMVRMEDFLKTHITPFLKKDAPQANPVIVIVSHGIILSMLWRCILKRFPTNSIRLGSGLAIRGGGPSTLEHIGGWSNTGYLELDIVRLNPPTSTTLPVATGGPQVTGVDRPNSLLHGYTMVIQAVNSKEHLKGLKRTGGGVGSSKFDEGQKTIDSFFKRRKV